MIMKSWPVPPARVLCGIVKLTQSNRFLRSRDAEKRLLVTAKTSSAIEGIRQPFVGDGKAARFLDTPSFTRYWKRRTASTSGR
jgi:hypothetical protein